jgi:hypothetical protein
VESLPLPTDALSSVDDALARVIRVGEALDDGEVVLARGLLAGLERELSDPLAPARKRHRCSTCGLQFDWPGQLDHHVRWVHESLGAEE